MRRILLSGMLCFISFGLLWAGGPPSYGYDRPLSPESSLHSCQRAVSQAAKKFIYRKVNAIGSCLQAVSRNLVKNKPDAASAAQACILQFSRMDDFEASLIEGINTKCDPSQDNVIHTLEDILGAGAGVMEPLLATNLDAYCASFGGDGNIDSLNEWSSCVAAASECAVDSAIAAQFPRALEWMERVGPEMEAFHGNPNRIAEAVAALAAVEAAIEGATDDNLPEISCGPSASVPTESVAELIADPTCPCSFNAAFFPTLSGVGAVNSCTVVPSSTATLTGAQDESVAGPIGLPPAAMLTLNSTVQLGVDAAGCSASIQTQTEVSFEPFPGAAPVIFAGPLLVSQNNESLPITSPPQVEACIADIEAMAVALGLTCN